MTDWLGLVVIFIVWGGFAYFISLAMRAERKKNTGQ